MGKQVWQFVRNRWKRGLLWGILLIAVFGIVSFKVGTLFPGASADEISYFQSVISAKTILQDPTNLPHKIVSYFITKVSYSLTGVRLVSVVFSIGFLLGAWYWIRIVFSRRTMIMGGLLLLFSSWFLIIARSAVSDSNYLLAIGAAAATYWVLKNLDSWKVVPIAILLVIPFMYVPGILVILLAFIMYYHRQLLAAIKALTVKQRLLTACITFVLLLPFFIGSFFNPALFVELLGIPFHLESIKSMPEMLLETIRSLVYASSASNPYTLVTLPYLDIFTTVLLLFGLYRVRYWTGRQRLLFITGLLLFLVIIALGIVPMNALLPFVYAMVIYGVSFLLAQWYTVFPKNPVARGVGASLLLVAVLIIGYYHVVKFYVAWPNTPHTDKNYNHNLIK